MSETDVALYANDVAGLLGDELAAVEAAVKIFIEDGERGKLSQRSSHSTPFRSCQYQVCANTASRRNPITSNPTLADIKTELVSPFKT